MKNSLDVSKELFIYGLFRTFLIGSYLSLLLLVIYFILKNESFPTSYSIYIGWLIIVPVLLLGWFQHVSMVILNTLSEEKKNMFANEIQKMILTLTKEDGKTKTLEISFGEGNKLSENEIKRIVHELG